MAKLTTYNLKVALYDSDFYALQALNSYLAWDRRTRVIYSTIYLQALLDTLQRLPQPEKPDVLVMDADHVGGPQALLSLMHRLRRLVDKLTVICLGQTPQADLLDAAAEGGARAFLLKQDVQLQITWAIVYALENGFTITQNLLRQAQESFQSKVRHAVVLPPQRQYPEMTERVRQAIKLCVIEGMPAHLAADEMGISLHTVRGYIKEGYRILEAYDETQYPNEMTPQERAFMRFTALAIPSEQV
ncbi:MAG: hypothetical protein NZ750_05575 [Anaerolineae bacterium]|nr:hypothetical protein [Anaerolineae bacterium]MDW8172918.1 hypothetical protein [Anaerolineae bacterium]